MYARILVPLDGSAFSTEVIPHAAGLAAANGAPLVLLRVVQKEAHKVAVDARLHALGTRWAATTLCVAAAGDVADTIVRESGHVEHTLVALTSHGHSGFMEAVLGSVALRIVRASPAPVLVYRPRGGAEADAAQTVALVVLALDGSDLSETMIAPAAEFARWVGARMEIVSVIDLAAAAGAGVGAGSEDSKALESAYVRASAERIRQQFGVDTSWETLSGSHPAEAIAAYVASRPGAVLALATRGRSAVRSALLGSVASGCLRRAGVPILMRVP